MDCISTLTGTIITIMIVIIIQIIIIIIIVIVIIIITAELGYCFKCVTQLNKVDKS